MSGKFKPGDLVEVIRIEGVNYNSAQPGEIGKIIEYNGDWTGADHLIRDAWKVKFPTHDKIAMCGGRVLRLIPGGDEYKEIGSWDQIPYWNPYKVKDPVNV